MSYRKVTQFDKEEAKVLVVQATRPLTGKVFNETIAGIKQEYKDVDTVVVLLPSSVSVGEVVDGEINLAMGDELKKSQIDLVKGMIADVSKDTGITINLKSEEEVAEEKAAAAAAAAEAKEAAKAKAQEVAAEKAEEEAAKKAAEEKKAAAAAKKK